MDWREAGEYAGLLPSSASWKKEIWVPGIAPSNIIRQRGEVDGMMRIGWGRGLINVEARAGRLERRIVRQEVDRSIRQVDDN
jgi:hypothetical protein